MVWPLATSRIWLIYRLRFEYTYNWFFRILWTTSQNLEFGHLFRGTLEFFDLKMYDRFNLGINSRGRSFAFNLKSKRGSSWFNYHPLCIASLNTARAKHFWHIFILGIRAMHKLRKHSDTVRKTFRAANCSQPQYDMCAQFKCWPSAFSISCRITFCTRSNNRDAVLFSNV